MGQDSPLVTVITPTYNHERYLAQCIESVLGQTEERWELIVIDDGSEDGTKGVALNYDDPRIRYTRQENAGILRLAETLNNALVSGRGDLIATLSGDDFWPKEKLAVQVQAFQDPDVVLSWGRVGVADSLGNVVGVVPPPRVIRRNQRQSQAGTFEALLRKNEIFAASVMFRRDVFGEVGGFQQPPGIPIEDWPTWLEFSRRGRFAVLDSVLGFYRRHDHQVTAVLGDEMAGIEDWLEAYGQDMSAEERRKLSLQLGVSDSEVLGIFDRQSAARSFARGRRLLQDGDQHEARKSLADAYARGPAKVRVRAVLALALTRVGVNVETVWSWIDGLRRFSPVNRARSGAERRSRRRTP